MKWQFNPKTKIIGRCTVHKKSDSKRHTEGLKYTFTRRSINEGLDIKKCTQENTLKSFKQANSNDYMEHRKEF